mmetsp:Transcript_35152/g.93704  ORF Transcript_35152/g.93704 Transcript_35152/m.93704 type:complete len:113 (-) Transcript_35152:152-490(-)
MSPSMATETGCRTMASKRASTLLTVTSVHPVTLPCASAPVQIEDEHVPLLLVNLQVLSVQNNFSLVKAKDHVANRTCLVTKLLAQRRKIARAGGKDQHHSSWRSPHLSWPIQ